MYMNIESRLTQRIGITGKNCHTGRSRNDQVATDIRLYLRDEIDDILGLLLRLQKAFQSGKAKIPIRLCLVLLIYKQLSQ